MLKRLSLLLTILLLLASLVEAFHYHDDGADHPQCSICAAHHQKAEFGLTGVLYHVVRDFVETPYLRPVPSLVTKVFFAPFNSRAPPVLSSRC
jgi:hypothetical protein